MTTKTKNTIAHFLETQRSETLRQHEKNQAILEMALENVSKLEARLEYCNILLGILKEEEEKANSNGRTLAESITEILAQRGPLTPTEIYNELREKKTTNSTRICLCDPDQI